MSKRKTESNAAVDANERSVYAMFRKSANLLSQFYSQSIHNQNLAFEAGESYAILEIHEWMLGKMREGKMITVADILGYLQAKMDSLTPGNGLPALADNASGQNSASTGGMAASSLAPLNQGSYPGMAACSSVQMEEFSFGPEDQNIFDMAAHLFAPEDPNSYLEIAGVGSSAPQEQDSYPDTQMDGM